MPPLRDWALAISASAAIAAAGCAPRDERPNFVLCMADDQGWGEAGYLGHAVLETPTLDAMAAAGLRLDRFYTASPVCSPARGGLLTGRHPNRFGCFSFGHTLQASEITLAEALGGAGYATGHFGKWHLGSIHPGSPFNPGANGFDEWLSSPNYFENDAFLSHNGEVAKHPGEGSLVVVEGALDFIRSARRSGRPFLAVLWFSAPHNPHVALEEDLLRYADQPEELRHYYGEITAMDRALGHLRSELRALGIADRTLLWYTSDNGPEPLGSTGGLAGGKGSLLEGGVRVPGILEWPGRILAPRASGAPWSTLDIYSTLLELAGAALPDGQGVLDGVSMVGLIDGTATERPAPLGFWVYESEGVLVSSRKSLRVQIGDLPAPPEDSLERPLPRLAEDDRSGSAAWIDGDYKLLGLVNEEGKGRYMLFDLAADPGEAEDLSAREPERAERMRAELRAWQGSVARSLNHPGA